REQALHWLRADLVAYSKLLDSGNSEDRSFVSERLRHWQRDSDLAGLRDKDSVAKLPAEEQAACKQLWVNVEMLLRKAEAKK
ncbi:MAG TPA: hypothetical protein VG013_25055, partial [Gemmataceae bacterium]|nr:hypothetical protein [Gemmataceae bacterium]